MNTTGRTPLHLAAAAGRAVSVMCVALACGGLLVSCDGSKPDAAPVPARAALSRAIISPPTGFSRSTQSDAHNGPMQREGFARMVGSSNAANEWHFVAGYEATFDSATDDSSVQIAVLQFTSPTTATNYDTATVRAYAAEGMVTTHTAGLATSLDLNAPTPDSTGHYQHLVILHKADRVVVILYYNRTRTSGRLATSIARQEYERV